MRDYDGKKRGVQGIRKVGGSGGLHKNRQAVKSSTREKVKDRMGE